MNNKPKINKELDAKTFKDFYYLKEELIEFCKENNLQTSGGKIELTNRIEHYLDFGEKIYNYKKIKKNNTIEKITLQTIIENDFVCSQKHREFYKEQIGKSFSFNVLFQKWLKVNFGKTYEDSIEAYFKILEDKKKNKTNIDKQFEYNKYIRDFFTENKDKNLKQAIQCWKYKKNLKGHNNYEKEDLEILV